MFRASICPSSGVQCIAAYGVQHIRLQIAGAEDGGETYLRARIEALGHQ